ncbi:hypothetical protein PAPYR_6835 [Paratrimastix pyriformis]|uniref:Uncharacterized protein n=1 Tax=Paratrimastix pyriformis TaxID=342808 RepID=A0ABQ8UGT2_9EUKA|nr:hypothetical protein PAPYR_6835 [Paratrimastix pyriformis]
MKTSTSQLIISMLKKIQCALTRHARLPVFIKHHSGISMTTASDIDGGASKIDGGASTESNVAFRFHAHAGIGKFDALYNLQLASTTNTRRCLSSKLTG